MLRSNANNCKKRNSRNTLAAAAAVKRKAQGVGLGGQRCASKIHSSCHQLLADTNGSEPRFHDRSGAPCRASETFRKTHYRHTEVHEFNMALRIHFLSFNYDTSDVTSRWQVSTTGRQQVLEKHFLVVDILVSERRERRVSDKKRRERERKRPPNKVLHRRPCNYPLSGIVV